MMPAQNGTLGELYDSERLHSAIGYLTPIWVFAGKMEERLAERQEKMYHADRALRPTGGIDKQRNYLISFAGGCKLNCVTSLNTNPKTLL